MEVPKDLFLTSREITPMSAENRHRRRRFWPRVSGHVPCLARVFSPLTTTTRVPSISIGAGSRSLDLADAIPGISQKSRSVKLGTAVSKPGYYGGSKGDFSG